jgi:hypothetical protein
MLVCLVNLSVAFVYVLGGFDSVLLGVLDDWILSFYNLSHIREHGGQFGESCFDALELVVAGPDGAEN